MNKIHFVVLLLALMFSATVKADLWAYPSARIFSSSDGAAAIKIVPALNTSGLKNDLLRLTGR